MPALPVADVRAFFVRFFAVLFKVAAGDWLVTSGWQAMFAAD
jgi:hypothetical protein